MINILSKDNKETMIKVKFLKFSFYQNQLFYPRNFFIFQNVKCNCFIIHLLLSSPFSTKENTLNRKERIAMIEPFSNTYHS